MNFYRCNPGQGTGASSSAESYTITLNGKPLLTTLTNILPSGFNQNIAIGNYVYNCQAMFRKQQNFNSNVKIGNNVVNFTYMFDNSGFNQNLEIPSPYNLYKPRYFSYMFKNCPMSGDIWFKNVGYNDSTDYMLNGRSVNTRINIYSSAIFYNSKLQNYLIDSTPLTYASINNNCKYNADQNIYLYRNTPLW